MISQSYITEWREKVPWKEDWQVEQDLIIERALLEIFSDTFLKERLVFRGGTALHKIYLRPQSRYSEDIDLVQMKPEPISATVDALRNKLNFLGEPVIKQKKNNNTVVFRFKSESEIPMKLKVEINCREHFAVFGYKKVPFFLDSSWHSGQTTITTYSIEELLGTKLRALYQRKKGRDLFDIWHGITQTNALPSKITEAFRIYLSNENKRITQKQFILNMNRKMKEREFLDDMSIWLRRGMAFNYTEAYELIKEKILLKL